MFGWFSPKCPLETWEKTWTEMRMCWLAGKLGIDRLLKASVVLPTEEFLPHPYEANPAYARRLLERLCKYIGLDAWKVELEVCADVQLPGAAGQYQRGSKSVIRVAESQLLDGQKLAATLAHELAHEILLGGGLLTADVPDHEWVTDLLPAFLGLGLFAANATISEASGVDGVMSWWSMQKHGYLPARIFGYAFALFAFIRQDEDLPWLPYLRLDASSAVREGLRFLRKTGDSLFHPDTIRDAHRRRSASELVDRLQHGTATFRLAALWEIREHRVTVPEVVTAVIPCLEERDQALPGEAARTLAALGPAAALATPLLLKALLAYSPSTRAGAAQALGTVGGPPEKLIPELCALLRDPNRDVINAAAQSLSRFGPQARQATEPLLAAFKAALIDCAGDTIEVLAGTLLAIEPRPKRRVREYFGEEDRELRRAALEALQEQRARLRPEPPAGGEIPVDL